MRKRWSAFEGGLGCFAGALARCIRGVFWHWMEPWLVISRGMRAFVVFYLSCVMAVGTLSAAEVASVESAKGAGEKAAAPATPDAGDSSAAIDGIAAGATLGLLRITSEEKSDEFSTKRFILHIPIKARPNSKIDPHELVIQVLFFDLVDNKDVVETSANVSSRWVTSPADWVHSDTEELAIEYQLPKRENENRKYFGYVVRLYYKKQLQVASAEPERLAKRYPSAATVSAD